MFVYRLTQDTLRHRGKLFFFQSNWKGIAFTIITHTRPGAKITASTTNYLCSNTITIGHIKVRLQESSLQYLIISLDVSCLRSDFFQYKNSTRWLAISSCPATFLHVTFKVCSRSPVYNLTNANAVYSHSKCNGAYNYTKWCTGTGERPDNTVLNIFLSYTTVHVHKTELRYVWS